MGSYVEKVLAGSNGTGGIYVSFGVVLNNTVSRNRLTGIHIDGSATVSGNNAVGSFFGFDINCPTAMIGNSAALNGINVNFVGSGCTFTGNAP